LSVNYGRKRINQIDRHLDRLGDGERGVLGEHLLVLADHGVGDLPEMGRKLSAQRFDLSKLKVCLHETQILYKIMSDDTKFGRTTKIEVFLFCVVRPNFVSSDTNSAGRHKIRVNTT
jgi:hypothetical protein